MEVLKTEFQSRICVKLGLDDPTTVQFCNCKFAILLIKMHNHILKIKLSDH